MTSPLRFLLRRTWMILFVIAAAFLLQPSIAHAQDVPAGTCSGGADGDNPANGYDVDDDGGQTYFDEITVCYNGGRSFTVTAQNDYYDDISGTYGWDNIDIFGMGADFTVLAADGRTILYDSGPIYGETDADGGSPTTHDFTIPDNISMDIWGAAYVYVHALECYADNRDAFLANGCDWEDWGPPDAWLQISNPIQTSVLLTSSGTSGNSVTYTAQVSPNSPPHVPTGSVYFYLMVPCYYYGTTHMCQEALGYQTAPVDSTGTATLTTSPLAVGTYFGSGGVSYTIDLGVSYSIYANYYSSDINHYANSPASNPITQVFKATPTVTVSCSNPITYGSNTTCTAAVNGGVNPSGTVTWTNNTGTWSTTVAVGTAVSVGSQWPAGTYTIVANYSGDSYNNAVTSSTALAINQASQTINFSTPVSPIAYGVLPISISAWASSGLDVSFSLISGPATVSGNILTITGAGTVVVAANQSGNANYSAASQVTKNVVVNPASRTVSVSCTPSSATYGNSHTVCTASVSAGSGSVAFTYNNGTTNVPITSGLETAATNGFDGVSPGTYTVLATAVGDPNYTDGASASTNFVVSQALTTTSLVCTPNTIIITGGNTNCTATVVPMTPASVGVAPTGSVMFTANGGSWSTSGLSGSTASASGWGNGLWPDGITPETAGSYLASANYSGDANYSSSTNSEQVTIAPYIPVTYPDAGILTTIAGNGTAGYLGDGGEAIASNVNNSSGSEVNNPSGIAVDAAGNVYIADTHNERIRMVDPKTGIISTVAGTGIWGANYDNGGLAIDAQLGEPVGVMVDSSGDLYITNTNWSKILKKTASTGIMTIVAGGEQGYSGDGGLATNAGLNGPTSTAMDSSGNLYIADTGNHVIRKVDASTGIITTVAGNGYGAGNGAGIGGYSGDSGPATSAELSSPRGVAVDSNRNIYIADSMNNVIRKVTASTGIITTVAGTGAPGWNWDMGSGVPATSIMLAFPTGVAVDQAGNFYIADSAMHLLRKVTVSTGIVTTLIGQGAGVDPTSVAVDAKGYIYVTDLYQSVHVLGPQVTPTILWSPPTAITYGANLSGMLNAVAEGDAADGVLTTGTWTYTLGSPTGTVVTNNTVLDAATTPYALYATYTPSNTVKYATPPQFGPVSLTVNQATPTISWTPPSSSITYGTLLGANLNATASPSGGTFTYALASTGTVVGSSTILNAGTNQTINVTYAPPPSLQADYTSATANITLTVNKKALTVTPNSASNTYGNAIPPLYGNITGLVAGDSNYITVSYTTTATATSPVGQYAITATLSGQANVLANYSVSSPLPTGTLTITPAALRVNPLNVTKAYGTTNPTFTANIAGVVAGDSITAQCTTTATASSSVGQYPITCTLSGQESELANYSVPSPLPTGTLTITPAALTITPNAGSKIYGTVNPTFTGTITGAVASDGITATYASAASTTTPAGVYSTGSNAITATLVPNAALTNYSVTYNTGTLTIAQATTTLNWPTTISISYGTRLIAIMWAQASPSGGNYTYTFASSGEVASPDTILNVGSYTLNLTYVPTDTTDYTSPATATTTITVNKAATNVTWAAPEAIPYGTALSNTQLNATANTPGTFTYTPASGTVLGAGGDHTLSVSFVPTDTTDYTSPAPVTTNIIVNRAAPSITWTAPAAISYGTALSNTQLNATANTPGTFTYTPVAGAILELGTQTLSVTFTPTDTTDYTSPQTATVNLSVNSPTIDPTVSVSCSPNPVIAGSQATCTATIDSTATGSISFSYNGNVTSSIALSGGSASWSGFNTLADGLYNIKASYSGDAAFSAASGSATLNVQSSTTTQGSTLYSYTVPAGGYEANGNVLAYTDTVMGSWTFSYDVLNRLSTAQNTTVPAGANWAANFCWAYDNRGNRLQQSTSDQAFPNQDNTMNLSQQSCVPTGSLYQNVLATYSAQNQLTSTNAPGFTVQPPVYDSAGDVTYDGNNLYLYDAEGRICAVNSSYGMTGYQYDAAGNRVAKGSISTMSCDITTNGFQPTAGYVVGPSGEQLTEVDGSGNWVHTNVYAGGKLIGTYDGNVNSPTLHFHIDDPLGTRRAQVSSAGVLEATYQSLPFGDGLNSIPYTNTTDPTENHFTNKERDTETGNDYMFARYYNSATGRFLSPDWSASLDPVPYAKLGDPQSLNLYAYVENQPITQADPGGHSADRELEQLGDQFDYAQAQDTLASSSSSQAEKATASKDIGAFTGSNADIPDANPGIESVDQFPQTQNFASVSYWPKGAGGFGHIGIQVNSDDTQGYSTALSTVPKWKRLFGAPAGKPEDDIGAHTNKSGEVATHHYIHIPISAAQAQVMQAAIASRVANGGHYNLIFNNCAQFVESVLHAGGVSGVPHAEMFGPAVLAGILKLEY